MRAGGREIKNFCRVPPKGRLVNALRPAVGAAACGRKRNDRFRDGIRGKLPFARHGCGGLFRPVSLIQIRPECATSGHAPYPAFTLVDHGVAGSQLKDSFARSVLPHQRRNSTKARMEKTRAPAVASHHFARNRCLGRSFATISSGLCLFLGIVVLLGSKAIPQGGPVQRGRIRRSLGLLVLMKRKVIAAGAAAGWPLPHDYRLAAKRGRNAGRPALRRPALKTCRCDGSCTAGNGKAFIENFGNRRVSSAPASRAPSVSWR
jgi:hypothetical protein